MASDPSSQVAHCPRCLCPLDTRQRYSVQVCLPAHPSYPPGVPNFQAHANAMMHPSLSSTPHHHHDHHHIDTPAPPYEPPRHSQPVQSGQGQVSHREHHHPPAPSSSGYQQPTEGGQDRATRTQSDHPPNSPSSDPQPVEGGLGRALRAQTNPLSTPSTPIDQQPTGGEQGDITDREDRRSSTSSSSTVYSEFSEYSINSDIAAGLQAVEDIYFPPQRSQSNSSPPPLPPLSSPPTEVSTLPNSSPPPESPSIQPISDGPPPTLRRWAVFRGRVPGIYASAAEATIQTSGFPRAFMLAFDDQAAASAAYEQFQTDGIVPSHGRGPWVVFVGRQPGVFTSFKQLTDSVVGFRNNSYRCCDTVEEGNRALRAFKAQQSNSISPTPAIQTVPESTHLKRLDPPVSSDDSWWICFAGAEPGLYKGLANLMKAAPAEGGAHRVATEAEGERLWMNYFNRDKVRVVMPE